MAYDGALRRRSFLSRLGAGAAALGALGAGSPAFAQSGAGGRWQPGRHAQDDWMEKLAGKHRFLLDSTTANGFGEAILYANNFFEANKSGYGLQDSDAAVVVVARHFATVFAYNDTVWKKYGAAFAPLISFNDPKTKQPPTSNLYNSAEHVGALPSLNVTIDAVLKRGVHLAVCQMATRFFATGMASATGGNADAIYNELASNLLSNAHLVPAGIVAVNRAQERGYSVAHAG
jgi:hypothetical protein